jgi:hypothetical protein
MSGPPDVCKTCRGFLGWHPHKCKRCRTHMEREHPEIMLRTWGYDPRRGQTWKDRRPV